MNFLYNFGLGRNSKIDHAVLQGMTIGVVLINLLKNESLSEFKFSSISLRMQVSNNPNLYFVPLISRIYAHLYLQVLRYCL